MKKSILPALMTVALLALVGCNANNETISNAPVVTSVTNDVEDVNLTNDSPSDEVIEAEIVSAEVSEVKSSETTEEVFSEEILKKTRLTDQPYTNDAVVYDLENTYYNEKGGIVVEGYIVNVTDETAHSVRLKKLELFNENNDLIASNSFGYIQDDFYGRVYVKEGEKYEVSLTFPPISVYIKDDDLDSVKAVSKFTSE